jgi:hypothetical protein
MAESQPVWRPGATFIAEVKAGAQLVSVDSRVLLVQPGEPPAWVTLGGLQPIATWPMLPPDEC